MVFVGWGFGSFLFYKIATAMMFEHGLNLVASALIGLLSGVAIYFLGSAMATIYGTRRFAQMYKSEPKMVMYEHMAIAVALASVAVAVLGWFVVQGFDGRFADQMSLRLSGYAYEREMGDFFLSMLVFLLPVALNGAWGLALYSRLAATKLEPAKDPSRE